MSGSGRRGGGREMTARSYGGEGASARGVSWKPSVEDELGERHEGEGRRKEARGKAE
jgi:hypothetical protein